MHPFDVGLQYQPGDKVSCKAYFDGQQREHLLRVASHNNAHAGRHGKGRGGLKYTMRGAGEEPLLRKHGHAWAAPGLAPVRLSWPTCTPHSRADPAEVLETREGPGNKLEFYVHYTDCETRRSAVLWTMALARTVPGVAAHWACRARACPASAVPRRGHVNPRHCHACAGDKRLDEWVEAHRLGPPEAATTFQLGRLESLPATLLPPGFVPCTSPATSRRMGRRRPACLHAAAAC
jgi:RNA binding activity-knot of a chromodomain